MAGLSFWTPLLPLFLSFAYCALTAHNLDKYPPSFVFEEEMKAHLGESSASPIDIRVTRALGDKGYEKMRVSVISGSPTPPAAPHWDWDYSSRFVGRWLSSFDLGKSDTGCKETPLATSTGVVEADCLRLCSDSASCAFYSFEKTTCNAYSACTPVHKHGTTTTTKFQDNHLHSKIVSVEAGKPEVLSIGGVNVTLFLPEEDAPTAGIVWSDPCISGRWVGCYASNVSLPRSAEMINALAEDSSWHYWQVLGDNYYDQDGRLSKAVYDKLSLKAKSKIFYTVPGNHDLWVAGGADNSDDYDQFGHGFMQWYAQDTMGSVTGDNGFLDFSIGADDDIGNYDFNARNSGNNFLWYNKIGAVGYIGFNGASLEETEDAAFVNACSFFKNNAEVVFVLGHWNADETGSSILGVPELREKLLAYEGCDIGDRLKYMDGHTHSNYAQQEGEGEEVGFMIGGHGMAGAGQFGFAYVKNGGTGGREGTEVWYFEEWSWATTKDEDQADNYDLILNCVKENGVDGCTHLATRWL